jgi:hypothetical protein
MFTCTRINIWGKVNTEAGKHHAKPTHSLAASGLEDSLRVWKCTKPERPSESRNPFQLHVSLHTPGTPPCCQSVQQRKRANYVWVWKSPCAATFLHLKQEKPFNANVCIFGPTLIWSLNLFRISARSISTCDWREECVQHFIQALPSICWNSRQI